jgi:hypothetical protein
MYYSSAVFRRKALSVLKGHWQTALLIALVVNLPTLLMQGISAVTGNDPASRLETLFVTASRDGILTEQLVLDEIRGLLSSTGFWTTKALELVAWLVTPCLTLGMYRWVLNRLNGLEDPVGLVFCRTRIFFKAIGLQLLIILKVLAWMLPGIAVFIAILLPVYQAGTVQEQAAALQRSYTMTLPAVLLMAVPGAIAALRYALAEYIMAEEPSSKILFCIRRSKHLMKDQKKNLFFLMVSFLLWYLLSLLVSSLVTGVFSLVIQMLASLALSVYISTSVGAFYLVLEKGKTPEQASDESEELN